MITKPQLLIFDIDGVLTNGRTAITSSGEELKQLGFRDIDALKRLARDGVDIAFVTGEDNPLVDAVAARFGVTRIVRNAKDKLSAIQQLAADLGLALVNIWYVGDADRDAPALKRVGAGFAPADASQAARAAAHRILQATAGNGVAEEIESIWRSIVNEDHSAMADEMRRIVRDSIEAHERALTESLPVWIDVAQAFIKALRSGHKLMFFGNGGSAADAQHVAGEFVGRFLRESVPYPAIALTTDTSILTAVGNDWAFEDVFARQVRALTRPGDVVVGITTSGSSPNVLRGLQVAREIGATTIGFTGGSGGKLPEYSDICFVAPAPITPRIQELHLMAWHTICELVEAHLVENGE